MQWRPWALPLMVMSLVAVAACAESPSDTPGTSDDTDGHGGDTSVAEIIDDATAEGVVQVAVVDVGGSEIGQVLLAQHESGTVVEARFWDMEPGYKGFHIHESPMCDADAPEGAFTSAGGHYTAGDENHPEHAGDLPPLLVKTDGSAESAVVTDRFRLDDLTEAGAAVIVHEQPDNQANIPQRYGEADQDTLDTGDAGDRIACGTIQPTGDS
ncbi:superoxide dismutase family protein [Phytoactinopolyspora halotolerans]|uniref:Superoxide dismutase [Cu-Zn] n=1 Tax=Phytoactinopolyspora halotolerans TaxID=1981512 RepID=A0A6L9S633_9ACTN|nr:superoxide dismutase family protein [Phytoactinopolyspora halotolerans]NED99977.1 superoxide dismutase family protein [Phytoactinopolyspora halotolerans]